MSLQALPPSATIWLSCRWVPHSQHETMAGRRAAKPSADGVRIWSAMIASPPGAAAIPDHGQKMNSSSPVSQLARQPLAGMLAHLAVPMIR
jgi:hypothetical protein